MASPLIDEDVMVQALKTSGGEHVRSGASMLLVDAFDRKATRDQFLAALGAVVGLLDAVSKHELMLNVKRFHDLKGGISLVDIEVTMHSIQEQMEMGCQQCCQMAELFQQCPLDEDKVH